MPTTAATYRLLFYSEKLLPTVNGSYTGCRIATHANGCAMATLGESTLTKAGRTKGKAGRRADLIRGWKGTGDTARPAFNQGHTSGLSRGMFPWLPQPTLMNTTEWSRVVDKLREGYAIAIAVRLAALPTSSPLRAYTSADHQILLYWDKRTRDTDTARRADPMHGHSSKYIGEPVPLADVRKAAKAIESGTFITELYPIGGWTAEARARARLNGELKLLGNRIERLVDRRDELIEAAVMLKLDAHRLTNDNTALTEQVRALTDELAGTQAGTRNAKAAGWESALVNAIGTLQALRSQGPGGTA